VTASTDVSTELRQAAIGYSSDSQSLM